MDTTQFTDKVWLRIIQNLSVFEVNKTIALVSKKLLKLSRNPELYQRLVINVANNDGPGIQFVRKTLTTYHQVEYLELNFQGYPLLVDSDPLETYLMYNSPKWTHIQRPILSEFPFEHLKCLKGLKISGIFVVDQHMILRRLPSNCKIASLNCHKKCEEK